MHAKALVCDENQNFSYADVTLPDPGPEHHPDTGVVQRG